MTRLVQRHRDGPYAVTVGGETKSICGCGLSGALPYCDATHLITFSEEPGILHWYDFGKQRHDAMDRYLDIRSDEPTQRPFSAQAATSVDIAHQFASDR
jgi:CDGSH iron-sulfur domain-containing protein 3